MGERGGKKEECIVIVVSSIVFVCIASMINICAVNDTFTHTITCSRTGNP
jgi:hypothetical protein